MSTDRINEIRQLIKSSIESYDEKKDEEITEKITKKINIAWKNVYNEEDFADQLCDMLVEFDNDDVPVGLRKFVQNALGFFEPD